MKQNFLVSIEALLDTKMAVLGEMNVDFPMAVLTNDWAHRLVDDPSKHVGIIDRADFDKRFKERDETTLHKSHVTNYMTKLAMDLDKVYMDTITHPSLELPSLTINTYPYRLADQEIAEVTEVIGVIIGHSIPIDVKRLPIDKLTPSFLKDNYVSVTHTSFDEWMSIHHEELKTKPIPGINFFAPRVYLTFPDDHMTLESDPFVETAAHLVEFVGLEWLPPELFTVKTA